MTFSRRGFIQTAAAFTGTAGLHLHADPLAMPVGTQTYPVRDRIAKDFDGTLKEIAGLGYKSIELCSPASYKDFNGLMQYSPTDLRKKIEAAGLRCESCHFGMKELREALDERIGWSKAMGLKQMVLASFGIRRDASLADWTKAAEDLNTAAGKIRAAGLPAVYHNHDMEFQTLDGVLVYDRLMQTFDPKLVKMQFQVSVVSLGYQAADFMEKYPGRVLSMHLQDWNANEKKQAAVGQGAVDWKRLFAAAKKGGVKNYFVEMNWEAMKPSYDFLHALKA